MQYKLGLFKSPSDPRDYKLEVLLPPLTVSLPEEYLQWLTYKSPVKSQQNLGGCAAFDGAAIVEEYNNKEYNTVLDLSEQFLYDEAKKIDGMPNEEGTTLKAICSVLKNIGICEESYLPYEGIYPPKHFPQTGAYENAAKYKISSYAAVSVGKTTMKTALFQNGPIMAGINVYESFMNTGSDGIVPAPSGNLLGGHGVPIIAYDKTGLIIKNSWAENWARGGYATIPWATWTKINMEAWSVIDITGIQTTTPKVSFWDWLFSLFKGR